MSGTAGQDGRARVRGGARARAPRTSPRRCAVALLPPAMALAAALGAALGTRPTAAAGQLPVGAGRPGPSPDPGHEQDGGPPATLADGTRRVSGRVVVQEGERGRGVPGRWVVLHRVSPAVSGPLDSVRTDRDGAYAFRYRPDTVASALYFATFSYAGLAYMTPPLREAVVEGDGGDIAVFDTTSAPVPITVRGRHVVVRPDSGGRREIQEVYEITNDSSVAAIAPPGSPRGIWSVPLPAGASDFRVRGGLELSSDGMTAVDGRAVLVDPLPPGLKQLAFRYSVPATGGALRLAVAHPTDLLEVLLAESGAVATAPGLRAADSVALPEGRFRRFLAQDVKVGGELAVTFAETGAAGGVRGTLPAVLALVGGAMVLALAVARRRQGRLPVPASAPGSGVPREPDRGAPHGAAASVDRPAPAPGADEREWLLGALVALDDGFRARTDPSEVERAEYARERAALKARLADVLAAAPGASR